VGTPTVGRPFRGNETASPLDIRSEGVASTPPEEQIDGSNPLGTQSYSSYSAHAAAGRVVVVGSVQDN